MIQCGLNTMIPTSLLGVFVFSFVLAIGAVISPGPVSTAVVSQAPRRGWVVGPLIASGHALLELGLVILIGVGLSQAMAHPTVQLVIAGLGGALLLWMGASMLRGALRGKVELAQATADEGQLPARQLMLLGVVTTLSNPFWYAWWMTVAAGYLLQAQALGASAVAAFYLGHISVDYAWDTLLAGVMGAGRRWIDERLYRAIIGLCGAFFLYLGVQYLGQAIQIWGAL